MKAAHALALLAIAGAFALAWGPGLGQFFSSDDFVLLHYCRDTSALELVRERLLRGPRTDVPSPWWRPGWLLLLNAGYEGFGLRPAALRGAVWVLHGIAAVLVHDLAARATRHRGLAVAATALFALAPSYGEALLWISAGSNVLPAALCLLVAGAAYARAVETGARPGLLVAWLGFLLSFLFREAGYHMPLVVLAAHLFLWSDRRWPRRLAAGVLHALPFGAVVLLHNLLLNPFTIGELSAGENVRVAAHHARAALHEVFALPPSPWTTLALAAAGIACFVLGPPRVRFCLAWAVAATFPFLARSHDTRFLYFAHAPLALALTLAFAPRAGTKRRAALGVALLGALAAANATRIPAKVRAGADVAAVNQGFLDVVRAEDLAGAPALHVDFLPAELANGAREALALYLRSSAEVVNHALLERPPFLIYGNPSFPALPAGEVMLHFDHGTRRFARTTKAALVAGRPLVPMFGFRHEVRAVGDWAEVRFDPAVVHLRPPLPDLQLGGEGQGKVVWVRAGTVQRFDLGVEVPRDGYLVFAFITDLTAVGGRAEVDGAPAPLLVADGIFNAIPVRRGSTEVVVRTAP